MNFRVPSLVNVALSVAALVFAGMASAGLRGIDATARGMPTAQIHSSAPSPAFDGMRRLAAGLAWVGVYGDWHRRDVAGVRSGMEWAVKLDPDVLLYWLDGARMLAYDVPAWNRQSGLAADEWEHLRNQKLLESMAWLERAREIHPDRSAIPIEQAVLWWSVARDAVWVEQALAVAQECADAPYFVGRIRAEMLVRQGRTDEALQLLRGELPGLDASEPRAMRSVVEQRIRELEQLTAERG